MLLHQSRWFWNSTTFITFLAFFFIISTTGLYGNLAKPVLIAAYIGVLTNAFAMVYFLDQINKLENKSQKELAVSALKWTLLGITLVQISIIIIVMIKF